MSAEMTPFEETAERCDRIVAALITANELLRQESKVAEAALMLFCMTTEVAEA